MIQRPHYLHALIQRKDLDVIKVITGIRRCGKSTLLTMYRDYLLDNGVRQDQICMINFEDMSYANIRSAEALHDYISERLRPDAMNYIFLDEIQNVDEFPRVVDSLYIKKNVDLYITGSNAYLLSSELATLLSGRYIEVHMLPLSFSEYIAEYRTQDVHRAYMEYIRTSSFPYATAIRDSAPVLRDYLTGIYSTIILKDVIAHHSISETRMLESVAEFMLDSIGCIVSTKSIADTMTSHGRKTSVKTVEKYLSALSQSYMLYNVKRYDIKGKKHLQTLEKYYTVDIGLRNLIVGYSRNDIGHILENTVFLELKGRGYQIYIGKVGTLEIDFVAERSNIDRIYIQVAATIHDDAVYKREIRPLLEIGDHYRKFLLSLDDEPPSSVRGVICMNVLDFLLDETAE